MTCLGKNGELSARTHEANYMDSLPRICYLFPNTDLSNNLLRYSDNGGLTCHDILIPQGRYEADYLDNTVELEGKKNHLKPFITSSGDPSSLKSIN